MLFYQLIDSGSGFSKAHVLFGGLEGHGFDSGKAQNNVNTIMLIHWHGYLAVIKDICGYQRIF